VTNKPQTVAEYIAAAPKPARAHLREMRAAVAAAAPGSIQSLKWGQPAFSYRRILVMFGAFEPELEGYKTASSSVQFPYDKPLPKALVRKITAFRANEERSKDAKWRVGIPAGSKRRSGINGGR
jgi:uncharacterized protein YdhG (YjbR/CyaY superfamily)